MDKTLPLPHNLYDYCSIRISSLVEKYLVVKRKISSVDKADILLTKLIIRGGEDNGKGRKRTDKAGFQA